MQDPGMVIDAILALGLLYVLLPVGVGAFRRSRATKTLRSPETGENAEMGIAAHHAAFSPAFREPELCVEQCSNWSEHASCNQDYLRESSNRPALHTISRPHAAHNGQQ